MSRGGRRGGIPHLAVEACHNLSAWGRFQCAQTRRVDPSFEIEWAFEATTAHLRFTRTGTQREQSIRLTWTDCHYGNERPWFECPGCGRRVGKVYLPEGLYSGGRAVWQFLCRHCYDLTYMQRQRHDQYWTLHHRAARIAERWLELSGDWIGRPRGQHQRTFQHRANQYENTRASADDYAVKTFARLLTN